MHARARLLQRASPAILFRCVDGLQPDLPCLFDALVLVRTITTSTTPAFEKRRGGRGFRKGGRKQQPRQVKNRGRSRIEELRAELAALDDDSDSPLELAPAIEKANPSGPPVEVETAVEMNLKHFQELVYEMQATASEGKLAEVARDFQTINVGGYTQNEWRTTLRQAAHQTANSTDDESLRSVIRLLSDKYWRFEHYRKSIKYEIERLPGETCSKLQDNTSALLAAVLEGDKIARCALAVLPHLPSKRVKEYQDRLADIQYRIQFKRVTSGRGNSMLPTFPSEVKMYCLPFNRWTKTSLKAGDIVSFSHRRYDGTTGFMTKRISAFGGDTVEFQGSNVVVPDDHIWVLGDNEKESSDSRHHGAVSLKNIKDCDCDIRCFVKIGLAKACRPDGKEGNQSKRVGPKIGDRVDFRQCVKWRAVCVGLTATKYRPLGPCEGTEQK